MKWKARIKIPEWIFLPNYRIFMKNISEKFFWLTDILFLYFSVWCTWTNVAGNCVCTVEFNWNFIFWVEVSGSGGTEGEFFLFKLSKFKIGPRSFFPPKFLLYFGNEILAGKNLLCKESYSIQINFRYSNGSSRRKRYPASYTTTKLTNYSTSISALNFTQSTPVNSKRN